MENGPNRRQERSIAGGRHDPAGSTLVRTLAGRHAPAQRAFPFGLSKGGYAGLIELTGARRVTAISRPSKPAASLEAGALMLRTVDGWAGPTPYPRQFSRSEISSSAEVARTARPSRIGRCGPRGGPVADFIAAQDLSRGVSVPVNIGDVGIGRGRTQGRR